MVATNEDPTAGWTPRRRTWAIVIVVLLIVSILAGVGFSLRAGLIGGGSHTDSASSNIVSILPSTGTRSGCVTQGPNSTEGQLSLQNGVLQTNVYAAPNGTTGSVGMCYDASTGDLFNYVNWSHVGGKGGWFSYPQIVYGVNEFEGSTDSYTGQGADWVLPQSAAAVVHDGVWVTTKYDYNQPTGNTSTGDDISFDNYLTPGQPPTWKVHPWVEVLVLLDHEIWSDPANWANWSMPTLVNSALTAEPWAIGYWCHGLHNGSNGNITFDFSYGGSPRLVGGLAAGTIGVNLSAVLAEVEDMLPSASCWTGNSSEFPSFYLGQEVFGAEAGVHTNSSFGFNWTDSEYCIRVDVVSPSPNNVTCDPSGSSGTTSVVHSISGAIASGDGARRRD
jgi:hypothetical protein